MKAFFVTQVRPGLYRLTTGSQTIEGNLSFIQGRIAEVVIDYCRDMPREEAYRFELASVLPSRSLANAVYELESVTRAKEAFYNVCKRGAPIWEKRELFDNLVTAATTMNLDNLWHALGVTPPDRAA